MYHQWQLTGLEDTLQRFLAVNEHIARRRTHKEFDARNATAIKPGKGICIVVRGTVEERVVHMTLLCSQRKFLLQSRQRSGLRLGIRHIKEGRNASCRCCLTLCIDVGLLGQSRLTEMYVVIDNARQHIAARSVDDLIRGER